MRPDVPPMLDAAIQRCLEKNPAGRFSNVAELAMALAPFGRPGCEQSVQRISHVLSAAGQVVPMSPFGRSPTMPNGPSQYGLRRPRMPRRDASGGRSSVRGGPAGLPPAGAARGAVRCARRAGAAAPSRSGRASSSTRPAAAGGGRGSRPPPPRQASASARQCFRHRLRPLSAAPASATPAAAPEPSVPPPAAPVVIAPLPPVPAPATQGRHRPPPRRRRSPLLQRRAATCHEADPCKMTSYIDEEGNKRWKNPCLQ